MDIATLLHIVVAITEDMVGTVITGDTVAMVGTVTTGDTVHMAVITEDMDNMLITVDKEPTTIVDQMV